MTMHPEFREEIKQILIHSGFPESVVEEHFNSFMRFHFNTLTARWEHDIRHLRMMVHETDKRIEREFPLETNKQPS